MTKSAAPAPIALLYVRVSTGRQAAEGHSLGEQERILAEAAQAAGYAVEVVVEAGKSAGKVSNRPALREALDRLDRGEAAALYALDLDRLSRSVADFAQMLARAARKGWRLAVLGLGAVDTSTAEGTMVAQMLAAAAQYERAMTSKRVKRQHEARRQRGEVWGVTMGPRPLLPAEVRERIAHEAAEGRSLRSIAEGLTADGIPTARGGRWTHATVAHVVRSVERAQAA